MATNNNTKDQILALFPDNNNYEITAANMRQYVEAIFNDKEVLITKITTLSDLAFYNGSIYEGSLVIVYNSSDIGLYLSNVNQPTTPSQLTLIANIGSGGGGSLSERGGLIYNPTKTYYVGDIVSNNNNAYIAISDSPIPSGAFDTNSWLLISSGNIQIVDDLNSSSITNALSANQGRILDETKEPNLPNGVGRAGYVLTLGNDEISKEWNPTTANALRWFSTITYGVNNMIEYNGIIYRCLQANTNQQPDISPSYWYNPYLDEAPKDGKSYWRKDGNWTDNTDYGLL